MNKDRKNMVKEKTMFETRVKSNAKEGIFVVKEKDEVVGFIELKVSKNFFNQEEEEYIIKDLYVDRTCRFKGNGRKLIEILNNLAKENNISRIIVKNVDNVSLQNFLFYMGFGKIINNTFVHIL